MIKKILVILFCLNICGCGGFSVMAGLKFKSSVDTGSNVGGNPNALSDAAKLSSGEFVFFERPIGKCGGGVVFFGILLPIIPVWLNFNNCEKEFSINLFGSWQKESKAKLTLKYNSTIHNPTSTEKLIEIHGQNQEHKYEYGKKFTFKIPNFWQFRMANDKAIIVTGKTPNGKDFTEELPVSWGVMTYYNWSFP